MKDAKCELEKIAFAAVKKKYGNGKGLLFDTYIQERLRKELELCDEDTAQEFLDARALVPQFENYLIEHSFYGNISATLLSYLLELTVTNPLPPHYFCLVCLSLEWIDTELVAYDLPLKQCRCGQFISCDGYDLDPEFFFSDKGRFESPVRNIDSLAYPHNLEDERIPRKPPDLGFFAPVTLPITLRLRAFGAESCLWFPDTIDPAFLHCHAHEVFVFREDLYRYLIRERNLSADVAFKYTKAIRRGLFRKVPEQIFPQDGWQLEYCRAVLYLPSKAHITETVLRYGLFM